MKIISRLERHLPGTPLRVLALATASIGLAVSTLIEANAPEDQQKTRTSTRVPLPPMPSVTAPMASAYRVYINPRSGKIEAPPPDLLPPVEAEDNTSFEGLEELPSPVPGGGFYIDLKRRFASSIAAKTSPGGKITTECSDEGSHSRQRE